MKRILLAGFAVGLLAVGPAMAADMRVKAPIMAPPPPAFSWTGCYLGGGGGYGMYDAETHLTFLPAGTANVPLDQGGRGWFGTVQGGCDYQLPTQIFYSTVVIGAFADGDWGNIRGSHTGQDDVSVGVVSGDLKLSRSWAVGGRIGYTFGAQSMAYVSGGYTEATFDQVNYSDTAGPTGFATPETRFTGYFIGSGYEYGFSFLPGLSLLRQRRGLTVSWSA